MNPTRVVNIRQVRLFDVRIMRDDGSLEGEGALSNPARLLRDTPRDRVLCLLDFLEYFKHRMGLTFSHKWYDNGHGNLFCDWEYRRKVEALAGKVLGCVCKPKWCHGDVYAAYLNDGEAGLVALEAKLRQLLETLGTM